MREEGRVCESRMRLGEFQKEQLPFWGHRLEPREYSGSRPPPPCAASEALSFLPPLWTFCCCYCYHSSSLSLLLLYPPTPPKKQANTGKSCPIQRKMREHFFHQREKPEHISLWPDQVQRRRSKMASPEELSLHSQPLSSPTPRPKHRGT